MKIETFKSPSAMVKYLKGLTSAQHFEIAKDHGIEPKTPEDAHLYADYIVQGTSKGLSGDALIQYAETNVKRLQKMMPSLENQTVQVAKVTDKKTKGKTVKTQAKPAPAPAPVKAKKIKHPDFTIVERKDRGGWEGWYAGRAEAFRTTIDKVQSFFQKKYQQTGTVI